MSARHPEILTPDPECDNGYIMSDPANSCWITVGKLSVNIYRGQDRLRVTIYPLGQEAENPIDRATAPITE